MAKSNLLRNIAVRIVAALPRWVRYRLGRQMYMEARGDFNNDMAANGERFVQNMVLRAVPADDLVIFDIGANVGDWTLGLINRLEKGGVQPKVHLFEPVDSTLEVLRSRIPSAGDRVIVEGIALSSRKGVEVFFVLSEKSSGRNSMHEDPASPSVRIEVPVETMAGYCNRMGIDHVHLAKCDAEGHDLEVIRGALPLLDDGRVSVMQFEYNHRWIFSRSFLRDVFEITVGRQYVLGKVQPDHVAVFGEWHPELERYFEGNYLLIRKDCLIWFPVKKCSFDESNSLCIN